MIIVSKRLQLKDSAMEAQAIRKMVRWLTDAENIKYSEQRHLRHSLNSQYTYINTTGSVTAEFKFKEIYLDSELVGTISAAIDLYNDVADVGILIGKEYWNRGIGAEAWETFCDHLLTHGVRKIEAGCMSINRGMIRIFEKTKMVYEGGRADHFMFEGNPKFVLYWGRFE